MLLEKDVICLMLHDLISTDDYTIGGVAAYAHVPEEVVMILRLAILPTRRWRYRARSSSCIWARGRSFIRM